MKLLLDECLNWQLGLELPGHTFDSVQSRDWSGIKNGRLLALAEQEYDAFITIDQSLSYQQSIHRFNIALIVLRAPSNRLVHLKPLAPAILRALSDIKPRQAIFIGNKK